MSTDGFAQRLACRRCGRRYASTERFCLECGMPLVDPDRDEALEPGELRDTARKISPQYASGDLVKVAWAPNQAEAELIQGMLLGEGIPSVQRRTRGFDVPEFLAGGPRDVLVARSAESVAREMLADVRAPGEAAAAPPALRSSPARLAAWVAAGAAAATAIVYGLYRLAG